MEIRWFSETLTIEALYKCPVSESSFESVGKLPNKLATCMISWTVF